MVDALVSGASAERRVGSSPILGTEVVKQGGCQTRLLSNLIFIMKYPQNICILHLSRLNSEGSQGATIIGLAPSVLSGIE